MTSPLSPPSTEAPGLNRYLASLGRVAHRHGQLRANAHGQVVGRFYRCELTTSFLPIVDARTNQKVGAEALLSCHDVHGEGVLPWRLFMQAATDEQAVALDRLSRTVHALNFARQSGRPGTLWLRVHARLVQAVATDHGRAFGRVLDALELPRRDVVIELDAETVSQPVLAIHACANYRINGFQVALALGASPLTHSILETARPDVVTFDVRDLVTDEGAPRRALSMAQARGLRSLARRVCTAADHDLVRASAVTWASGPVFAEPSPVLACTHAENIVGRPVMQSHTLATVPR